jgi:hypothetical protein
VWLCTSVIPATQEAEAGGLKVQGQLRLHRVIISKKERKLFFIILLKVDRNNFYLIFF